MNNTQNHEPQKKPQGSIGYVYLLTLVAALGGMLFGYDTGVIAAAEDLLVTRFNLSSTMEGWTVSCALIGCMIGVAAAGFLSDRFGRKKVLILSAIFFFASAVGTALPRDVVTFILFRMLGGLAVGAASMTSPLYIAEISPAKVRGRMVSINQFAIVTGFVIVYFINLFIGQYGVRDDHRQAETIVNQFLSQSQQQTATVDDDAKKFLISQLTNQIPKHYKIKQDKRIPVVITQRIFTAWTFRNVFQTDKHTLSSEDQQKITDIIYQEYFRSHLVEKNKKDLIEILTAKLKKLFTDIKLESLGEQLDLIIFQSLTEWESKINQRTAIEKLTSACKENQMDLGDRQISDLIQQTFTEMDRQQNDRDEFASLIQERVHVSWNLARGWRFMFGSEALPAIALLLLLFCVPESPRWLTKQNRSAEALAILSRVGGQEHAQSEFTEIKAALDQESGSLRQLLEPGMKIVLVIGVILAVLQQITGINVIMYYGPKIFKTMGFKLDAALLWQALVGAIMLSFTLIAIWTVDKLGRKILMIVGTFGMGVALLSLGLAFFFQNTGSWAILFIFGYIACFSLSIGPVVWVVLSEIFPTRIRGRAMGIATLCLWFANYVISQTFPMMNDNAWLINKFHHAFPFWIYSAMCAVMLLFVWRFVPETKGKTLEEIEHFWKR